MAKRSEIQYVRYYATGSEALKLDPQPQHRKKARAAQVPAEERKVLHYDPVALFGTAVAVLLVVCVVIGFIQLNQMNDRIAQAQNNLSALKSQHYELETNYKNGYDLDEVRDAADAMGLVPMEQVEHITVHIPEPEVVEPLPRWQQWWLEFKAMFE